MERFIGGRDEAETIGQEEAPGGRVEAMRGLRKQGEGSELLDQLNGSRSPTCVFACSSTSCGASPKKAVPVRLTGSGMASSATIIAAQVSLTR